MRTILMVLMIAGLMSTVGVYAASISAPTIGVLGGHRNNVGRRPHQRFYPPHLGLQYQRPDDQR